MNSQNKSGFTLLEIMIVVVIVGLLALIAIPGFNNARVSSQNSKLANDLRVFAGQIEIYSLESGDYPEDSSTGELPEGLDEYINVADWTNGPSIGGEFDVEKDDNGVISAVGVVDYTAKDAQLQRFEKSFDNLDFTTGTYQKLSETRYYYVVAQ
ncbi:MAG: type II secretion system protein [Verrucomicrobiota bacterium]